MTPEETLQPAAVGGVKSDSQTEVAYHTHNGSDSPPIDRTVFLPVSLTSEVTGTLPVTNGGTGKTSITAHKLIVGNGTSAPTEIAVGTSGQVLTSNGAGSDPSFQALSPTVVVLTAIAGETLVAGDVVFLYYVSAVNYATDAYDMSNGNVYAILAAADDTTYGPKVYGIVTVGATVTGTATIAIVGGVTGLSGLTPASYYYLDNHSATSATTISQTSQSASINLAPSGTPNTLLQIYTPTQDLMDSITLMLNGQGIGRAVTITIKRHTTQLFTGGFTGPTTQQANAYAISPAIRTYKGESLNIFITGGEDNLLYYQSGGSVYNGSSFVFSGPGSIAANSDVYFSIKEFNNFGKLATAAGTRKFNLGTAYSATALNLQIQPDNTLI